MDEKTNKKFILSKVPGLGLDVQQTNRKLDLNAAQSRRNMHIYIEMYVYVTHARVVRIVSKRPSTP